MEHRTVVTSQGYLSRLLTDGARPFRYRSRVRGLLGLPEISGVQVNFPQPLPAAGFPYVRPRFTGEFEFPDEPASLGVRPAFQPQPIISTPARSSAVSPPGETKRATSPALSASRIAAPGGPAKRVRLDPAEAPASKAVTPAAPQVTPVAPVIQSRELSVEAAPQPSQSVRTGQPAQSVLPTHQLTIPGVRQRPDASPQRDAERVHNAEQIVAPVPRPVDRADQHHHAIMDAPPVRSRPDAARRTPETPESAPRRSLAQDAAKPRSSSPTQQEPAPQPHELPTMRSGMRSIPEPYMGTPTNRPDMPSQTDASRALPSRPRPNRTSHRESTNEVDQSAALAPNPPTAAASPAPVPAAQPATQYGATSQAYWERRYLGSMRLRIRR